MYRDGNLISGTLEALLKHMVPTSDYYPDQSYLFAFLLSARLFIKPHELLQQVCDICHQQQQLNIYLNNNNNNNNNGVFNQVLLFIFSQSWYYMFNKLIIMNAVKPIKIVPLISQLCVHEWKCMYICESVFRYKKHPQST